MAACYVRPLRSETFSPPAPGQFYHTVNEVEYAGRYNIAPGSEVVAIAGEGGERQMRLMRWGLVPSWAKDYTIGQRMINARAETVEEKPAYRASFKRRRCVIPASGFFEWQADDQGAALFQRRGRGAVAGRVMGSLAGAAGHGSRKLHHRHHAGQCAWSSPCTSGCR